MSKKYIEMFVRTVRGYFSFTVLLVHLSKYSRAAQENLKDELWYVMDDVWRYRSELSDNWGFLEIAANVVFDVLDGHLISLYRFIQNTLDDYVKIFSAKFPKQRRTFSAMVWTVGGFCCHVHIWFVVVLIPFSKLKVAFYKLNL